MSEVSTRRRRRRGHRVARPHAADVRVVRSRAAAISAARSLFLRKGYAGTTMDEVATAAGLTKRTLYNNYADKDELFIQMVAEVTAYAEAFARGLREEFTTGISAANVRPALHDLGRRLALGIVRSEVIALRRLLIGEARQFPALARQYFDRAPGQVLAALAAGFERLKSDGLLQLADARRAAAQFAYLAAGELLDRAMLVGTVPSRPHVIAAARDGVETFLARYGAAHGAQWKRASRHVRRDRAGTRPNARRRHRGRE